MAKFDYDVLVIGSSAGGGAVANISAQAGKRVALIENTSGTSASWGDLSCNALLHAAGVYDGAKNGGVFGIRAGAMGYNYPTLKAWKDTVLAHTGGSDNKKFYESRGIQVHSGQAHFISPHEVTINRRHLSAGALVIATGASWEVPAIPGLDKIAYLTPRTTVDLIRPPKSMCIIGAGTSGVEFATLLATFGTKVYIIDAAPRLLPAEDEEVGALIGKTLHERKGVTALTSSRVSRVAKEALAVRVYYQRGGQEHSIKVDTILVATARVPNVDIGLQNAGIDYTPSGIAVNKYLQTSAKHIYAVGDVLGEHMYAHVALYEGRLAAHNILHRDKLEPSYKAVPRITYSSPEVASVGLSANDCIKRDMSVTTALAPITSIVRSGLSDTSEGFVKLLADKKGLIVGATVAAPHAGEIIHELALAIGYGMSASHIAGTLHAIPSWSEAVRVAAGKLV